MGALPRTSMPGPLLSRADYERIVAAYRRMEFIESGSELWWDVRPSEDYPTVEMRICGHLPASGRCGEPCRALRVTGPPVAATGPPWSAAARSAHGDHRRESLAGPALRRARFPRQRLGQRRTRGHPGLRCPARRGTGRRRPRPRLRGRVASTCSRSSTTAAAPTGSSTTSVSAAWRGDSHEEALRAVGRPVDRGDAGGHRSRCVTSCRQPAACSTRGSPVFRSSRSPYPFGETCAALIEDSTAWRWS